jgi:hypothetical protein
VEIFISHASEDKDEFVRPLAEALSRKQFSVWYDEYVLTVGDSLRESIDKGLRDCTYGIVIFSEHFFEKKWPRAELNALFGRMMNESEKRILPVLHGIPFSMLQERSPLLADLYAVPTSIGLDAVVKHLIQAMLKGEADRRHSGETVYTHAHYDHNYYNPPGTIAAVGYRFEPPHDYGRMMTLLRPREILMCFLRNVGAGGWNSACHITCKERMRDIQRDADAEYYAVDMDRLDNDAFDHPFSEEQLRRIYRRS